MDFKSVNKAMVVVDVVMVVVDAVVDTVAAAAAEETEMGSILTTSVLAFLRGDSNWIQTVLFSVSCSSTEEASFSLSSSSVSSSSSSSRKA